MTVLAQDVYLDSCLEPLGPFLARADVTDIHVNRPCEVWIEELGGDVAHIEVPTLSARVLERLARQVAALNAQGISREHPLLSGRLPDGSRIQIVFPPATRGPIALSIRKHLNASMSLGDYVASGAFDDPARIPASVGATDAMARSGHSMAEWLSHAVRERRNILVSGGTSTGKTTFLNALLREIPRRERLILIEDTPELQPLHKNSVGLLAARGGIGEAAVTIEDLLVASLRMRPDRIVLGEMRGAEAQTFLRAVNTGHPGSMSTIHADSPERAIDQLALLVMQTGTRMSWDDVVGYIRRSIDIVVQLARRDGARVVEQVAWIQC